MYYFKQFSTGELRSVANTEKRIQEARRMGFSRIIMPKQNRDFNPRKEMKWGGDKQSYKKSQSSFGIECVECETLREAINAGLVSPIPKKSKRKTNRNKWGSSKERPNLDFADDNGDDLIIDDSEDYDDDEESLSFQ